MASSTGRDVTDLLFLPATGATGVVSGKPHVSARSREMSGLTELLDELNSISEPEDIKRESRHCLL